MELQSPVKPNWSLLSSNQNGTVTVTMRTWRSALQTDFGVHPSFQAFCSSVINEYNPADHELPDISCLSEFGFRGFVPGCLFSTLDVFKRRRTSNF